MKEERLVQALDAQLPDEAAKARMWSAIEAAWDAAAAEEAADQAADQAGEAAPGFTVVRGGQAASRRTKRYSWKAPAVAAVLVVAIGAGVLFFSNGGMAGWFGPDNPDNPDGPAVIIDDSTPGSSGSGTDGQDVTGEVRYTVEWEGKGYVLASAAPLDESSVGERLGTGIASPTSAGEGTTGPALDSRDVDVFAPTGRYATGSYIVVSLDGAYLLYIAQA